MVFSGILSYSANFDCIIYTLSQTIYFYSIGVLVIVTFMFLQLSLRPYKEEFKMYNITDAFMLLILSRVFIMATAGDEADVKASYFSTFSYSILGLIGIVPIIYFWC